MLQPATSSEADPAPQAPTEERRAAVRYLLTREIACQPMRGPAPAWQARIRDLSVLGIGLILPERVELRSLLAIHAAAHS